MLKIKEILHKKKPLIAALTAGDPNLKATEKMLRFFDKLGIDIAELSLPFNEALALSPEKEASFQNGLQNEVDFTAVFTLVKKVKKRATIALILHGSFNLFLSYGLKRFFADAASAGVDGIIIDELLPERSDEIKELAEKSGLAMIYTVTTAANKRSLSAVAARSEGYLRLAEVGSLEELIVLKEQVQALKQLTTTPLIAVCTAGDTSLIYELFDHLEGVIVDRELLRRLDVSTKALKKYLKTLMKELNR